MSFEDLAIVLTAIAVGSYFKGAVGIGLPTIAVPTLAAFIGAEHAIVVLTIPVAASNVWICWRYRKMTSDVPHLKISLICAGVGTASGAFVLASLSDNALLWLIIVWLGLYLIVLAFKPDFQLKGEAARRGAPVLALVGGMCQGATGIAGPIIATWIHSYRLHNKTYVFAASLMFLAISGTHVFAVGGLGLYTEERIYQGLLAVIPTVLFTQFGMWTTPYISPVWFNRLVIAVVIIMWIKLILQATTT
ncbi:MAG: sulfite exporter TauE/SafE family protein [Alphaproteobacteria bacterium]